MNKIAIICTNDVHCAIDGYATLAAAVRAVQDEFGPGNVCLVDAGDAIGGGVAGLLTQGEAVITLMERCNYVAACPGNADFSFGVDRLVELASGSSFPLVCCNFVDAATRKPVFAPYALATVGGARIAFVGVLTPQTLNAMNPECFDSKAGMGSFDFCGDADGRALYDCVQAAVDDARAHGADCVIALGHLGQGGQVDRWRSDALAANTHGIDAIADGHSHECYTQAVANAHGRPVAVLQSGVNLAHAGTLVIDCETGAVDAQLLALGSLGPDPKMQAAVKETSTYLDSMLNGTVGEAPARLVAREEDGTTWRIRSGETNLGDLVADAFRNAADADIAFVPSWVVRCDVPAGDITMGDLYATLPIGTRVSSAQITGQMIVDMLEYGARHAPGPSGSFVQVSGVSYVVDTSIPSSVEVDGRDCFVAVNGPRRVRDVRVFGEPVRLDEDYLAASVSFVLSRGGNGFSMLDDSIIVQDRVSDDVSAVAGFIQSRTDARLGRAYANPAGSGRIKVL